MNRRIVFTARGRIIRLIIIPASVGETEGTEAALLTQARPQIRRNLRAVAVHQSTTGAGGGVGLFIQALGV